MKQFSPIILFFIFLLLYSCNEKEAIIKREKKGSDSIHSHIDQSRNDSFDDKDRLAFSDKAYSIAKSINVDTLIHKSLYNKLENDIGLNQDSLEFHLNKLKEISKDNAQLGRYFYQKGSYFKSKRNDSSYYYFKESKKNYLAAKDSLRAGYSLLMIAGIQRTSADYFGVESTLTEALPYFKNSNQYTISTYNMLGLSYKELYDYESALSAYEKALEMENELLSKSIIRNNIALIQMDQKLYPEAIKTLTYLNSLPDVSKDPETKARVLSNLGYCYFLSKTADGLPYLMESINLRDAANDDFGFLATLLHLSEYHLASNQNLSRKYASEAYSIAQKLKNDDDKLKALEFLAKTSKNKIEADELFSQYVALDDSIKVSRQQSKNQFAKIRYDFSTAEENLLKSELVAEKRKRRNELLLVTIIFLLFLGTLLYRLMRYHHAREKSKESYKTETRISKKVHDELANDIYNVITFSDTQDLAAPEKKEKLLHDLDDIYIRTRDISKENSTIETDSKFVLQLKDMLSEYRNADVHVIIGGIDEIQWMELEANKKIAIYRILQELMINMKKHSKATLCLLTFKNLKKNIEINYSDNGIGIKPEKLIYKNGLANMENRIATIKGKIKFDQNSQKGLKITIVFPA